MSTYNNKVTQIKFALICSDNLLNDKAKMCYNSPKFYNTNFISSHFTLFGISNTDDDSWFAETGLIKKLRICFAARSYQNNVHRYI